MSIHKDLRNEFFEPFAGLCASDRLLKRVEGQFSLLDGSSSLTAIKLSFDGTSVVITVEADDSISLEWNSDFIDANDHQVITLDASTPWNAAILKPLIWSWIMINQQGYFDGLRMDFAESSEMTASRIELIVVAGEFKYQ